MLLMLLLFLLEVDLLLIAILTDLCTIRLSINCLEVCAVLPVTFLSDVSLDSSEIVVSLQQIQRRSVFFVALMAS